MVPGHPYTENDERATYGRRLPKDPPMLLGGQGRTEREVADGGMVLVVYTACAIIVAVMAAVTYWVTR